MSAPMPAFRHFHRQQLMPHQKGALTQFIRTLALEAIDPRVRMNAVGAGDTVSNILTQTGYDRGDDGG